MGVALGTLRRESEDRLADAVHPVEHLDHAELLSDDGPFLVDHAVAQETGRDEL